jgi:CRP-like cAMP-binding protein
MATDSLFLNAPVHRTVGSGEVIYAEGDEGAHMFGIVSGSVTLHKGAVVVASLGPDDVFGERALIDRLPRNLTARRCWQRSIVDCSSFWSTSRLPSPWVS